MGNSWGTILGVLAVQQRPYLFHAYVGTGQMVSPRETDWMMYEDTIDYAVRTGKSGLIDTLESNGPPPYDDLWGYATVLAYEAEWNDYPRGADYEAKGEMPFNLFVPEYTLMDQVHGLAALLDVFAVMYPQIQDIDFRADAPALDVPVYIVAGAHEAPGRAVLVDEWFADLDAPIKEMIVFDASGHRPSFEEPARFTEVMARIAESTVQD